MSNGKPLFPPLPDVTPHIVRAIYQWITENGATPHVLFNANHPKVEIPPFVINAQGQCILNISPRATNNFTMSDEYLAFQTRFSGKSYQIFLPMDSLIAMFAKETGQGMALSGLHPQLGTQAGLVGVGVGEEGLTERALDSASVAEQHPAAGPDIPAPPPVKRVGHLTVIK